VSAQTTEFTYQGSLSIGSPPAPATGNYDFEFRLFSVDTGGSAIGTLQRLNVPVSNGVFSVKLDFGAQFPGASRYLEIGVRTAGGGGFQTLLPRNQISNTPYAVRSLNAASADTANQLSGIPATGFIQNTTSQQPASNFNISGNGAIGGNLGVGTTAPGYRLDVVGRPRFRQNTGDTGNINTAGLWLFQNTTAERAFVGMVDDNSVGFYGNNGGGWGLAMNTQTGRVGIGTTSPASALHLGGNSGNFAMTFTNAANTAGRRGYRLAFDNDRLTFQKADDFGNFAANQLAIDQATGNIGIGTTSPNAKLEVSGSGVVRARVNSDSEPGLTLSVNNQPQWSLSIVNDTQSYLSIINESTGQNAFIIGQDSTVKINHLRNGGDTITCNYYGVLAYCSSSLRYKTNIAPFGSGLNLVKQLAPITFNWKESGKKDFGLGAEDVEKLEPLLVTYNDKGEVEGVKYDRVAVVLINAVKEQQAQIETLQKANIEQQTRIDKQEEQINHLLIVVCSLKPRAEICKEKE